LVEQGHTAADPCQNASRRATARLSAHAPGPRSPRRPRPYARLPNAARTPRRLAPRAARTRALWTLGPTAVRPATRPRGAAVGPLGARVAYKAAAPPCLDAQDLPTTGRAVRRRQEGLPQRAQFSSAAFPNHRALHHLSHLR
jgi:hypothetical protein